MFSMGVPFTIKLCYSPREVEGVDKALDSVIHRGPTRSNQYNSNI